MIKEIRKKYILKRAQPLTLSLALAIVTITIYFGRLNGRQYEFEFYNFIYAIAFWGAFVFSASAFIVGFIRIFKLFKDPFLKSLKSEPSEFIVSYRFEQQNESDKDTLILFTQNKNLISLNTNSTDRNEITKSITVLYPNCHLIEEEE